jgi:phosphoribosylglycinamide formyltransferase-1
MTKPLRLGFLASHAGSSMRTIVMAINMSNVNAVAEIVISNNSDAPALEFARSEGIKTKHISKRTAGSEENADRHVAEALARANVDLVILSGYLRKVGPITLKAFHNRILNIHPSLLPKYGGKGMYGRFVHEAILNNKEKFTGATIHLVDGEYDHGSIIDQKVVPVRPDDTIDTLKARVMAIEGPFFLDVVKAISARRNVVVPSFHHRLVSTFSNWEPGHGKVRTFARCYLQTIRLPSFVPGSVRQLRQNAS